MSENESFSEKPVQYNYSSVDMDFVIANPTEYIIPECLPACEALWEKNIPTFMTSNYDDTTEYYILLSPKDLSEENLRILEESQNSNPENYTFDSWKNCNKLRVPKENTDNQDFDKKGSDQLLKLTDCFSIQDTQRYQDTEEFLKEYKTTDGEIKIKNDEDGFPTISYREENPKLKNATLEEALKATNKHSLYVRQENRIYNSPLFLEWHERYLRFKSDES